MTNNIPGWNFESDTCVTNQKNTIGPGQELVELLWQNGQVVFNSQTQRKRVGNSSGMRQDQKNNQSTLKTSGLYGNSSNLSQEDEAVSWLQYPLEDPLEQQFCSNFLSEIAPYEIESYKPIKQLEEGNFAKFAASSAPHATLSSQSPDMKPSCVQEFQGNPMPVPRFHVPDSSKLTNDLGRSKKVPNFSHFSTPPNVSSVSANAQIRKKISANISQSEARECSVMTVGSSHCGSNHIPLEPDVSMVSSSGGWATNLSDETEAARDYVQRTISSSEKGKSEMAEPNLTSSSGGSGSSLEKTCSLSTGNLGQKRKRTDADAEELEEQSEATELKSGIGSKASQQAGYSRRNRAAEVHNLSERRRRDRINEKMRALQQLIPNSNKTDKASMLEEAIEYLKSLQLQLQVMCTGAGMSPMMFPGRQHYMSQMSIGMAAPFLPSIQNPMQLPRVPLDQSMPLPQTPNQTNVMCQNPVLGAFIYQNQMQNSFLAEQYARYMGYYLTQSATQPMNAYRYGSLAVQNSQTMIAPGRSSGTMSGASNKNDAMSANMGSSTFN